MSRELRSYRSERRNKARSFGFTSWVVAWDKMLDVDRWDGRPSVQYQPYKSKGKNYRKVEEDA